VLRLTQLQLQNIIHTYFDNSAAVYKGYSEGNVPSPLRLRNGMVIYHDPADNIGDAFYEIFVRRCYTDEDFYHPASGDVVFDLGANIGVFALYLASSAPGIQIHCFEPSAEAFARLLKNVAANGLTGSIHVYPFAVFNECCQRELLDAWSTACKSFFPNPNTWSRQDSSMANCITLATALKICGVETVDFLKMDVEGAEVEIIESLDFETWKRIRKLAIEYHDDIRPSCLATIDRVLKENGFRTAVDNEPPYGRGEGIIRASQSSVI